MNKIKLMNAFQPLNRKRKSYIILDEGVSIETSHGIDRDHALDGVFGEFCFSGLLLGPDYGEGGVELGVPVVGLGDNDTGTFPLHNHGVDEVLEGFLSGDEFIHDNLVDLVNPVGHLSLLVLFSAEGGVDGLVDGLLEFLGGELDLLELLGHGGWVGMFELIY